MAAVSQEEIRQIVQTSVHFLSYKIHAGNKQETASGEYLHKVKIKRDILYSRIQNIVEL